MHIVFKEKTATHDKLLKKAGLTTLYNLRLQDLNLAILMYQSIYRICLKKMEQHTNFVMEMILTYQDFRLGG